MAEQTYLIDQDLNEAAAMTNALDGFVRTRDIYGSVGLRGLFAAGTMPALTLGALQMRLRRLRLLERKMESNQKEKLADIVQSHAAVYEKWYKQYNDKMLREALSRTKAMDEFFRECAESPQNCARNYLPEALRRTIIRELVMALDEQDMVSEELDKLLRRTDTRLHRVVRPSDFIWDDMLEPIYGREQFWWLYGQPTP